METRKLASLFSSLWERTLEPRDHGHVSAHERITTELELPIPPSRSEGNMCHTQNTGLMDIWMWGTGEQDSKDEAVQAWRPARAVALSTFSRWVLCTWFFSWLKRDLDTRIQKGWNESVLHCKWSVPWSTGQISCCSVQLCGLTYVIHEVINSIFVLFVLGSE